jgi:hypothetical protein
MATKTKRRNRERKDKPIRTIAPTPEQLATGHWVSAGMAVRRVPQVDTLLNRDVITRDEWAALTYYRDQYIIADRSLIRSGCDFSVKGEGTGSAPPSVVSALCEIGRMDRDLGALRPIVEAVAGQDMSLTEWCCAKHGSHGTFDSDGRFIRMEPNGKERAMKLARLDIRMAARRIVK